MLKTITISALLMFGSPVVAGELPRAEQERLSAACVAWGLQLNRTIELMHVTGTLRTGDAVAARGVVDLIASRCHSPEARRMSDLMVLTLELLTDAPNQP